MSARTPRRTCVGCRRTAEATELIRVSRCPDGSLRLGPGPGRGAWLCAPPRSIDCLEAALHKGAFQQALRRPVERGEVHALRAKLRT